MGSQSQSQQPPLPLPPHMRARADRELPPPPAAAAAGMTARPPDPRPQQGGPYRVAEVGGPTAREAPVVAAAAAPRIRPPGQEPRPYRANEGHTGREAPVAARIRPPGQEPRPYRADEGRVTAREARAPVATIVRPPGPYCAPEGREAREAPAAAVPRSPEPYCAPEVREAPAAAVPRSPGGPYHEVERREAPISTVPMLPEQRQEPYYAPESRPAPYPYYAPDRPVRMRRTSPLASCLLAAVFLLLAGGGAAAALFILFRPRPPDISVAAVRLPTFAAGNGTVAFTFEQMATVRNPNRAPLSHFDSSLRVAYAGGEVGSVYIPAGLIDGGHSKYMSASFAVPAFPAATPPPLELAAQAQQQPAAAMVMEVDSLLVVKGKVTVLWVLMHRVQASKVCRVGVSPVDGRVLGFRC